MITNNIYEVFLENEHGGASYGAFFGTKPTRSDLLDGVKLTKAVLQEAADDENSDQLDCEAAGIHLEKLTAIEELILSIKDANIDQAIQRSEDSPIIVAGVCIGRIHIDVKEVLYRRDFKIILPVVPVVPAIAISSGESRLTK